MKKTTTHSKIKRGEGDVPLGREQTCEKTEDEQQSAVNTKRESELARERGNLVEAQGN